MTCFLFWGWDPKRTNNWTNKSYISNLFFISTLLNFSCSEYEKKKVMLLIKHMYGGGMATDGWLLLSMIPPFFFNFFITVKTYQKILLLGWNTLKSPSPGVLTKLWGFRVSSLGRNLKKNFQGEYMACFVPRKASFNAHFFFFIHQTSRFWP